MWSPNVSHQRSDVGHIPIIQVHMLPLSPQCLLYTHSCIDNSQAWISNPSLLPGPTGWIAMFRCNTYQIWCLQWTHHFFPHGFFPSIILRINFYFFQDLQETWRPFLTFFSISNLQRVDTLNRIFITVWSVSYSPFALLPSYNFFLVLKQWPPHNFPHFNCLPLPKFTESIIVAIITKAQTRLNCSSLLPVVFRINPSPRWPTKAAPRFSEQVGFSSHAPLRLSLQVPGRWLPCWPLTTVTD